MKLTKEVRKVSKDLFQESFTAGRLDEEKVRSAVQRLVASKPRHHLEILKNYQRLLRLEIEKRHAVIESASTLDWSTSQRIVTDLKARYGNDVTTEFRTSSQLIGGLRIRVGSDVWDGSVKGRLARLEQELVTA